MKFLNKTLARQANKKIDARVAFEKTSIDYPASRADFLSQEALLSCSLRRSESDTFNTLETSDHTSIKERFASSFDLKKQLMNKSNSNDYTVSICPKATRSGQR